MSAELHELGTKCFPPNPLAVYKHQELESQKNTYWEIKLTKIQICHPSEMLLKIENEF